MRLRTLWVEARVRRRLRPAMDLPILATTVRRWALAALAVSITAASLVASVSSAAPTVTVSSFASASSPASAPPAAPHLIEGSFVQATPRPLLAVTVGGSRFTSEDLRRTYGSVPAVGLRVHVNDGPSAQYFLGIQYASRRGDSFYDDPVFESSGSAKLVVMPIEFGLRTNLRRGHRPGVFLGIAGEYSRIWERVRGTHHSNPRASETIRGWGLGVRVVAGPEFELGRGPWIMGTEFSAGRQLSWTGVHARSNRESRGDHRTVELTGLAVRAYLGRRL